MIVLLNGVYVNAERVVALYPQVPVVALYPQVPDNPFGVVLVLDVPCDRPMTLNIPGVTADQVADVLWGQTDGDWRTLLRKLEA